MQKKNLVKGFLIDRFGLSTVAKFTHFLIDDAHNVILR